MKLSKVKIPQKERVVSGAHDKFDKDRIVDYQVFSQILSKLRSIIDERTTTPTKSIDGKATVKSIAKSGGLPNIVYKEVVEENPKLVVLVDVGGSVDAYRDITLKLIKGATKGSDLDDVQVYYFHNAIYGYVWPETDGNWCKNEIPLESVISHTDNTKMIILGDAWMADHEYWGKGGFYDEGPKNPKIPYREGEESFHMIKQALDENVVWVNPLTEEERERDDNSGTIEAIEKVFPMYELTYRGLEGAVSELMKE